MVCRQVIWVLMINIISQFHCWDTSRNAFIYPSILSGVRRMECGKWDEREGERREGENACNINTRCVSLYVVPSRSCALVYSVHVLVCDVFLYIRNFQISVYSLGNEYSCLPGLSGSCLSLLECRSGVEVRPNGDSWLCLLESRSIREDINLCTSLWFQ